MKDAWLFHHIVMPTWQWCDARQYSNIQSYTHVVIPYTTTLYCHVTRIAIIITTNQLFHVLLMGCCGFENEMEAYLVRPTIYPLLALCKDTVGLKASDLSEPVVHQKSQGTDKKSKILILNSKVYKMGLTWQEVQKRIRWELSCQIRYIYILQSDNEIIK